MPRRGENIRKRRDGRWEGRYYVLDAAGKKYLRSVYARTYQGAREKLAAAKYQNHQEELAAAQKRKAEPGKMTQKGMELDRTGQDTEGASFYEKEQTFGNAAAEWLGVIETEKKHSTFVKYQTVYRKYLKGFLENRRTEEIDAALLGEAIAFQEKENGSSISSSLLQSIYCVANQILEYAGECGNTECRRIPCKKGNAASRQVEVLSRTDQARLLKQLYADMDTSKMGIVLCLLTGLRLGEVCCLKWQDIDMEHGILSVNRTVQRIAAEGCGTRTILMESAPKSVCSKREIPLSAGVMKLLLPYYRDYQKRKGTEKNEDYTKTAEETGGCNPAGKEGRKGDYILLGNKPMEPRTYQNHLQKYLARAGVEKKNFHVLRHTFATNCIDAGTDVKSLSEILGHADVKITLNRYVHPTIDTKRRHMDTLSSIYGQIVGQSSL